MKNWLVDAISQEAGKELTSVDFYLVILNGEIDCAFESFDEAQGYVDEIEDENTRMVISESGRDANDLTEEEYMEMEIWGGAEGDYAYVSNVSMTEDDIDDMLIGLNIDEDDEEEKEEYEFDYNDGDKFEFETEEGDTFTYAKVLNAYRELNGK